jgi:hypothetical protein
MFTEMPQAAVDIILNYLEPMQGVRIVLTFLISDEARDAARCAIDAEVLVKWGATPQAEEACRENRRARMSRLGLRPISLAAIDDAS